MCDDLFYHILILGEERLVHTSVVVALRRVQDTSVAEAVADLIVGDRRQTHDGIEQLVLMHHEASIRTPAKQRQSSEPFVPTVGLVVSVVSENAHKLAHNHMECRHPTPSMDTPCLEQA